MRRQDKIVAGFVVAMVAVCATATADVAFPPQGSGGGSGGVSGGSWSGDTLTLDEIVLDTANADAHLSYGGTGIFNFGTASGLSDGTIHALKFTVADKVNTGANVVVKGGEATAANSTGGSIQITGGGAGTGSSVGGAVLIEGGFPFDGTGGDVNIRSSLPFATGSPGNVNIGTTQTTAVNIGAVGKTVTINGTTNTTILDGTLSTGTLNLNAMSSGVRIAGQLCEFWGGMQPYPAAVAVAGTGIFSEVGHTESDDTSGFTPSVDGVFFWQKTTAVSGNDAGIISANGVEIYTPQANPLLVYKFALPDSANFNAFLGLSSTSISGTINAANPVAETIGISFVAGTDTNFIFYTSTDGTNFTKTDSGVAKDAAVHYLVIDVSSDGTTVDFSLYDRTGAQEGTTQTVTTDLPAAATTLSVLGAVQTSTTVVKELRHYWWRCGMRPD